MTESEIIKGCIKKDAACQHELFKKYAGVLMGVCLRYTPVKADAEDVLQDAFMRIFSRIHQFRSEGSFEGWLKRITANCALKKMQKRKISFDDIHEQHINNIKTDAVTFSNLTVAELLKQVSSLPEGYRIVFNLYVMEGYSHSEIGELLNIEEATSRSQLSKARKFLQAKILMNQKIAI